MKTKKCCSFLTLLLVLTLCLVHTANARAEEPNCFVCDCPCDCSLEWVWEADGDKSKDIKNDYGIISHTDDGLLIDVIQKDLVYDHSFEIPGAGKNYLSWHANLQVRNATGGETPGIGLLNDSIGFSFLVDRNGSLGSLVLLDWGSLETTTIEKFDVPKFDYPCTIGLRYDVVTRELTAFLNDAPVKKVKLPYYGMPAAANFSKVSILTRTQPHNSIGTVLYGDLTLAVTQ